MSPPDDEGPVERAHSLVGRLESGADPEAVVPDLARTYVSNGMCYAEEAVFSDESLETLFAHVDGSNPRIRSHLAAVVRQSLMMQLYSDTVTTDTPAYVERLLELGDDPNWRVRQAVVFPMFFEELVDAVTADPGTWDERREPVAETVVDRLDDPVDVVRKRAGEVLVDDDGWLLRGDGVHDAETLDHTAEMVLWHPDPEGAISTLVDTLSNPVDTVQMTRSRDPVRTVGGVLLTLGRRRPDLLSFHESALRERLVADDVRVRLIAIDVLERTAPGTVESLQPLADSAASLLDDENPRVQVAGAVFLDRLALRLPDPAGETDSRRGPVAVVDACLGALERLDEGDDYPTFLFPTRDGEWAVDDDVLRETAASLATARLTRLDDYDAIQATARLDTLVGETEMPAAYTGALDGLLEFVAAREPSADVLGLVDRLASADPERATQTLREREDETTLPDEVTCTIPDAE